MTNQALANLFREIADMLDILGEDPFRALSYARASRAIEGLTEDVAGLVAAGRLSEIPGIGSALADKIREFVETGAVGFHGELRARLPSGLLDLLSIRGLGPKKVRVLWQDLGIADVETLRQAVTSRRLRRLKGFGEKTEANLLRAIELRAEAAGSFRRGRETVGDVDILAIAKDRAAVSRAFVSMPGVREVVAAGETKATVLLEYADYVDERPRTVQVDLRILEARSWGAGLQYFTGSKDHNVHLRGIAQSMGLKLNEYGVFRGEEPVAGETEEGVYAALGLPWIPPEMREDEGEIELAREGALPKPLKGSDVKGDIHVHTDATDGTEPLEAMVDAARRRGYAYVGISDHSVSATVAFGLTADRALARRDPVREINARSPGLTVLLGTECDILDGGAMDYPDEALREFDFVLASVHSKFTLPRKEMTARLVAAVENPHVDVLGHPTTRLIGRRDPIDVDLAEVFAACSRAGTAVEVNGYPNRMDLDGRLAREAKKAGCRLVLDTDSHASAELDAMALAVATARRAWLTPDDIVNAWPLERVREFFG